MADLQIYFRELVEGKANSLTERLLLSFLRICACLYGIATRLRSLLFALNLIPSNHLSKPVISVGNLTAGGTGKTPTVAYLARFFIARGKRVAVLSRGYGGTLHGHTRIVSDGEQIFLTAAEAGDEPFMLAATVPGLMVVIGPDRYRAGVLAEKELNPDIFLLDDGFQHLRLKRDVNVLLLDCARPYGNGRLLPAGLLREPPSAAKRADVVVYTRCGESLPENIVDRPFCRAVHKLAGLAPLQGGDLQELASLAGERVMAFAGIADPAAFFDALEGEGVRLITTLAFPDHACYGAEELEALARLRKASRSTVLVTTEKDAVKLAASDSLGKVYAARLEMRLLDDEALRQQLEKLL